MQRTSSPNRTFSGSGFIGGGGRGGGGGTGFFDPFTGPQPTPSPKFKPLVHPGGFGRKGLIQIDPYPSPGKLARSTAMFLRFARYRDPISLAGLLVQSYYDYQPVRYPPKPANPAPSWVVPGYFLNSWCNPPDPGSAFGFNQNICGNNPNNPPQGGQYLNQRQYDQLSYCTWSPAGAQWARRQQWVRGASSPYGPARPYPAHPAIPVRYVPGVAVPFDAPAGNPFLPDTWLPGTAPAFPPRVPYKMIPLLRGLPHVETIGGGSGSPPMLGAPYGPPPGVPDARGPGYPPHYPRPPQKGEKEKKKLLPLGAFSKAVKGLANVITETNDAVKAVYGALPGEVRAKNYQRGKTMQGKLQVLYENAHRINIPKAIGNLIYNHLEDKAIGKMGNLSKKAARANPYWNSPVGFQAGGRYRPYVRVE